uniref:mRNA cap guanine-N(7) methyltransferase n=1 Tax=Acrobeloides nanus TaxID=290746 RepID=A0A914E161_9BILA
MSANQVASHYNAVPNTDKISRTDSRIYYLRNLNNWIKSLLISEFLERLNEDGCSSATVLDLCCGKGGDLLKWQRGRIKEIVMADIAEVSLKDCESRYNSLSVGRSNQRPFKAQFIAIDLTKNRLSERFSNPEIQFDIVSCQFALHYSFRSEQCARQMLQNVTERLRPGGYFIGALPDANRIVHLLRQGNGFYENDVCRIEYTDKTVNLAEEQPPLFGAQLTFNLDEVVNCPEYLAYFPLLSKMLEEFGMELVYCKAFPEAIEYFRTEGRQPEEAKNLLSRMSALEPYKPNSQLKGPETEYAGMEVKYTKEVEAQKTDGIKDPYMGILSKSEWEVISMYLVFAFRKK